MDKDLLFEYVERLCRAKPGSAPMEKVLYDIFVKEFIEKGYTQIEAEQSVQYIFDKYHGLIAEW